MTKENTDVAKDKEVVPDLYEELNKELAKGKEEETPVASDETPADDKTIKPDAQDKGDEQELSEEEISKLSPRAQKRIRELAEKVKELANTPEDKTPEETPKKDDETSPQFKSVQEFLSAVEDEPSRKLLETFYTVIKGETSSILAPIEQKNREAMFETEFAKYEAIEGLSDHKSDLRKTFLRNPNQSIKSLIGEVVTDLQLHRVKPIEETPSSPNRDGKVDLNDMSKDELYDTLDSLKK